MSEITFFNAEKVQDILIFLLNGESYAGKICRKLNVTYSHTVRILKELERIGLVVFRKEGRIMFVKLKNGKAVEYAKAVMAYRIITEKLIKECEKVDE